MVSNEVPLGSPCASPSSKAKIPLYIDSSLAPSVFPGSFQDLISSFQHTDLSSGVTFLYPITKPNILPSNDPLTDIIMLPINDSTYPSVIVQTLHP